MTEDMLIRMYRFLVSIGRIQLADVPPEYLSKLDLPESNINTNT